MIFVMELVILIKCFNSGCLSSNQLLIQVIFRYFSFFSQFLAGEPFSSYGVGGGGGSFSFPFPYPYFHLFTPLDYFFMLSHSLDFIVHCLAMILLCL